MNHLQKTLFFSVTSLPLAVPVMAAEQHPKAAESTAKIDKTADWRASHVIGSSVQTTGNESIGHIEDFLIDPTSGKITSVIVSTGGFLGVADTLSAIPLSAFHYDAEAKVFHVNLTKEQLAAGEKVNAADWKAGATTKLKAARDAVGGDVTKPDNTARNERDMKSDTVTPMDQGSSEADIKTTKNIRMAVVEADLSFNAKNIKIITKDGNVVLRGVVQSAQEHDAILKMAQAHAAEGKITDQLEINK